jgi:hypothetical protein
VPAEELKKVAYYCAVRQNLPGEAKASERGYRQQQCQGTFAHHCSCLLESQTAQWNEQANGWK